MSFAPTFPTPPIAHATLRNDRGMQELLKLIGGNPARAAASALMHEARPVAVCTGFPVGGHPETDGPPGAYALIDALLALGRRVRLASWRAALEVFGKVRPDVAMIEVPVGPEVAVEPVGDCSVVTIEVCGRCEDGSYRNMHGDDIRALAPRFEEVFGAASLVSVGDGGNEFGMGSAPPDFLRQRNILPPVSRTQNLVPASVSNYGAYAIVKELEALSQRTLLPRSDAHLDLIRRLVEAGCVDGYSGRPVPSIDGAGLEETGQVLDAIRAASVT